MSDLIGGCTIHPQRPVVGGFTKWPTVAELEDLGKKLESASSDDSWWILSKVSRQIFQNFLGRLNILGSLIRLNMHSMKEIL